jgi:alpha-D-ribose 1-methylphosphonate 5-triphosphate synthase subunit PhnH
MTDAYPVRLDAWLFAENQVLGLPRTARIANVEETC